MEQTQELNTLTGRAAPILVSDVDHVIQFRGCECPSRDAYAIEAVCITPGCPRPLHHLEGTHRAADLLRFELNHNGLA